MLGLQAGVVAAPRAVARPRALERLRGPWWAIVPDGLVITLLIMGCFLLGQAIEDALNPRLRVAHLSSRRWALRPLAGRGPDAI